MTTAAAANHVASLDVQVGGVCAHHCTASEVLAPVARHVKYPHVLPDSCVCIGLAELWYVHVWRLVLHVCAATRHSSWALLLSATAGANDQALGPNQGRSKAGHIIWYTSSQDKSAWFCRYGWLVHDIVGNEGPQESQERAMSRSHWRHLIANAVFFVHMCAMAGIMGGWASYSGSAIQVGLAIGIKAVYTQ